MGLFPQSLLLAKSGELKKLERKRRDKLESLKVEGAKQKPTEILKNELAKEEAVILEPLRVSVLPLEGEELLARIETVLDNGKIARKLEVTDFAGSPQLELESFEIFLNPLQTRKDIFGSFYETHLYEIPERLEDALRYYLSNESISPELALKERFLRRRFGRGLEALRRVVLAGMGSSFNVALMAKPLFHRVIPELDVAFIRPVEVEHLPRIIDPEKDLVVLLSWSGTSADMVQFAQELATHHVAMVGITEKPFSDMALVTQKSCGVVPIMSGEEMTYSAVKSPVSMLLATHLVAIWLAARLGHEEAAMDLAEKLVRISQVLRRMIEDQSIREFSERVAELSAGSYAAVVFDALNSTGVGREVAAKLEENSWSAMGKALDYQDLSLGMLKKDLTMNLVIVNATHEARLQEALEVMKFLYISEIPFAAVSYDHPYRDQVRHYSQNLDILLPKEDDPLQPFIDLFFNYHLALRYGQAHGRMVPGFPRNRAKSITVSRGSSEKILSPGGEIQAMGVYGRELPLEPAHDKVERSVWEKGAHYDWEAHYYQAMKRLAFVLAGDESWGRLILSAAEHSQRLDDRILSEALEEGEIILLCLDRQALSAARDVAVQWGRLVGGMFKVVTADEPVEHLSEDAVLFVLATTLPDEWSLIHLLERIQTPVLWLGPALAQTQARIFAESLGCFPFSPTWEPVRMEVVFGILNLILIGAWKKKRPHQAKVIEQVLGLSPIVVEAVLNDSDLRKKVEEAMISNQIYRTASFIGSSRGTGLAWVEVFERVSPLIMESYYYGDAAHGPVVTVDPDPEAKFVRIQPGLEMVSRFGPEQVALWEELYLHGCTMDEFLSDRETAKPPGPNTPFLVQEKWYLPVLRPDYDATQDNLIVMDASSQRDFYQVMDALGVYGCRYPRLLLVFQEAFESAPQTKGLYRYPIGHILSLPALDKNGARLPIPELLLPFAMNLLGAAMASSAARCREVPTLPPSLQFIFLETFGALGPAMVERGIGLGNLNHLQIDALRTAAPMVETVEGVSRYEVRVISEREELLELVDRGHLYGPEEVLESFQSRAGEGTPFYIVRPQRESFQGKAHIIAAETFDEKYWEQWFEVYGNSWRGLHHHQIEMGESASGEPLIELPLLDPGLKEGWLYHFYVRYWQWNHSLPFEEELAATVKAMGKETTTQDHLTSKYVRLVSLFNNAMVAEGVLWTDDLLAFVPRSWPLRKHSKQLADLLVERTLSLVGLKSSGAGAFDLEDITRALMALWPQLAEIEKEEDERRWSILQSAIVSFF
jgi:fructoselysine-6-P-deglycase FrlB-like protein